MFVPHKGHRNQSGECASAPMYYVRYPFGYFRFVDIHLTYTHTLTHDALDPLYLPTLTS
jgi:hypothetical protein